MSSSVLLAKIIPGVLSAIQGAVLTRETLAKTLEQLGQEIREGKHIPENALERAEEDQELLRDIFGE